MLWEGAVGAAQLSEHWDPSCELRSLRNTGCYWSWVALLLSWLWGTAKRWTESPGCWGVLTFRIINRVKCSEHLLRSCGSKANRSEHRHPVLAVHRDRELPSLLVPGLGHEITPDL